MKRNLWFLCGVLLAAGPIHAQTTINSANRFAYGANIGWINWHGDGVNGAVIGAFVCSGSIYSANTGWINLGDGTPANGTRYLNNSATDFGVNHDGAGNLHGFAYGANIGWLTFTNRDATGAPYDGPRLNLMTGQLCGYIWSANCGWISLCNGQAFVQTDTMDYGPDTDGDGIPDQWERQFAGNLGVLTGAGDNDGDGFTNTEEFTADTDPFDPASVLRFTNTEKPSPASPTTLTWTSSPTRQYRLYATPNLILPVTWTEVGLGLIPGDAGNTTTRDVAASVDPHRFFIVGAIKPLQP